MSTAHPKYLTVVHSSPDVDRSTNTRTARRPLQAAVRLALALCTASAHAVRHWRLQRQMLTVDPALLKDIGVPRCGLEWALRHGRDVGERSEREPEG